MVYPKEYLHHHAPQKSTVESSDMRFRFPRLSRSQFELAKFTFYLMTPITIMYYVGIDTDRKFNVPGYWPDPDTLNKIPKEPHEIQAELARIRQERLEKRRRLEEKARQLGITPDSVDKDQDQDQDQDPESESERQQTQIEAVLSDE